MGSYRKLLLCLIGVGLVLGAVWWKQRVPPPLAAAPIGGRLELAAGDVQVRRDGALDATVSGMSLAERAQVRTGKGARALIRLAGGGSAFLGDTTTLTLASKGVTLDSGRMWLDIPSLPEPVVHQLGFASVAVASAGLSVERNAQRIDIYVARGLAVVGAKKARREVAAGEHAIITASGEVKVEPVAFWSDWTGGMADRGVDAAIGGAGSGKLYAVDRSARAGTPARPLEIKRQAVRARIADGIAETEVDQSFWNPGDRAVEGYYWFTVPEHALVTGFALETNGVLVEGEVVERKEAAAKYEAAVERANDPALLEWIDGRSYRARIFPVPALGSRRVVLRYVEPVSMAEGRIRWVYPLAHGAADAPTIDEFSLSLELGALGKDTVISTLPDARVEKAGELITMRRSVYSPRADFQVELVPKHTQQALRATRFDSRALTQPSAGTNTSSSDQADFVMLRWVPDLDWGQAKGSAAEIVLALDVSAGGDDADRQLKLAVAEATLRNLAAGDHFAVMTTDVQPRVIYPDAGLAPADEAHVSEALERMASRVAGGATDLGAMFDPGLSRLHAAEQPALLYIGDGVATSGELGGAQLVERLRRSLEGARARFFSIGVGTDANHPLLERLAAVGGGRHFRVDDDQTVVREALQLTAAIKTPTITDLELDVGVGLDEPLSNVSGKLAHGTELWLLARTHHDLPASAKIRGRLGGKPFERVYELNPVRGAATPLLPRLWAAEFARRILGRARNVDEARGKIVSLALEYGLVTPFSSILALDSEDAYRQMGIPRVRRAWDRLPLERAALEPSGALDTALAVALGPLTLISGCDSRQAPAVDMARATQESAAEARTGDKAVPASRALERDYARAEERQAGGEATAAIAERSERVRQDEPAPALADLLSAGIGGGRSNAGYGALGTFGDSHGPAVRSLGRDAEPRAKLAKSRPRAHLASARTADAQRLAAKPAEIAAAPVYVRSRAYIAARTCSDLAARPLPERMLLWARRLRAAVTMREALDQYDAARAVCEIAGQRDQRALLGMLERFADNVEAAELMFAHFAHDPDAVARLARQVLRHTLDPYVAAVARREAHAGTTDWPRVELELAALPSDAARIERLRALLLAMPDDVEAQLRVMKLLVRTGKQAEALPMAARLRARGMLSPLLLRDLGDVQVAAGAIDDALRTYTEIVEFDPHNPEARRLVGDTLLANGWYDVAYRQFRTLVDMTTGDASSQMRLALAAAGAGRSDEALRILRHVAESDAEPGVDDPRLHARLLASALIARLIEQSPSDATRAQALMRQLKQLQVLSSPGRLCVLTWDALDSSLGLGAATGDMIDASSVGVIALSGAEQSTDALLALVRARSERGAGRAVAFKLQELVFDGKSFSVKITQGHTS